MHLRNKIEFCPVQQSVNDFYNGAAKCLVRGKNWAFKYKGLRLFLQGLKLLP